MTHSITLQLPEPLYERIKQMAKGRSVEEVLVKTLEATMLFSSDSLSPAGEAKIVAPHVLALAKQLRQLKPNEVEQVIRLVPELERSDEPSKEDRELVEYFRNALMEMNGGEMPKPTDECIDGISYEEYWALSEAERDAIWTRIFAEDETGPYSLEERELVNHVRKMAMELTGGELPKPTDEFLDGLSYQEYFALSEKEQDAIWERIFAEDETGPYSLEEHDAYPTDMATRQKRGSSGG